jgi:hypothetical protein
MKDYDIFTEYKKGFPRLRATAQTKPTPAIIIFSDTHFSLDPLDRSIICHNKAPHIAAYSRQIMDLMPNDEIKYLPVPCLAPFLVGLCRRFLESNDSMARIAVEQLVDGMGLDEQWVKTNLSDAGPEVLRLAMILVSEKWLRRDDFSTNLVTCFIANEEEAGSLRRIPGSGYPETHINGMSPECLNWAIPFHGTSFCSDGKSHHHGSSPRNANTCC